MSRPSGGARRRLTQARVDELHSEIGGLHERLDELERRLEARDGAGVLLADAVGQAALRVLREYPKTTTVTSPRRPQEGTRRR